jgi:hypothetical protein
MMARVSRIAVSRLRLYPFLVRSYAYSTALAAAQGLATHELERVDQTRELELRNKQAPNRIQTWATSQRPRNEAFNHPRFEGAILEMQVKLLWMKIVC